MTKEAEAYMKLVSSTYSYRDIHVYEGVTSVQVRKIGKDVWDNPDYVIHIDGTERFTPLFYEEIILNREHTRGGKTLC